MILRRPKRTSCEPFRFERARLGPDNAQLSDSLNNLAETYRAQERIAEAESLLKRTLLIREKVLGVEHPAVINSLDNLARLYNDQSRFADAEPLEKRALEIAEKILGPEHVDVAARLLNLVHRLIRSVHEDMKSTNVFKLLESVRVNHSSVSVH